MARSWCVATGAAKVMAANARGEGSDDRVAIGVLKLYATVAAHLGDARRDPLPGPAPVSMESFDVNAVTHFGMLARR